MVKAGYKFNLNFWFVTKVFNQTNSNKKKNLYNKGLSRMATVNSTSSCPRKNIEPLLRRIITVSVGLSNFCN